MVCKQTDVSGEGGMKKIPLPAAAHWDEMKLIIPILINNVEPLSSVIAPDLIHRLMALTPTKEHNKTGIVCIYIHKSPAKGMHLYSLDKPVTLMFGIQALLRLRLCYML